MNFTLRSNHVIILITQTNHHTAHDDADILSPDFAWAVSFKNGTALFFRRKIFLIFSHFLRRRIQYSCHFVIHSRPFPVPQPVIADTKLDTGNISIAFLLHKCPFFCPFFCMQRIFIPEYSIFPFFLFKYFIPLKLSFF